MTNINIYPKKYWYGFKENALCIIAGLSCLCALLYASFLLYPLAIKVLQYLNHGVEVINSAIRGCYR